MPADKVRADYEALTEIAKGFDCEAEKTRRTLTQLHKDLDVLLDGDWRGRGAEEFYREMIAGVLPSVKRLGDALGQAVRATTQISRLMKQAEDDCAALFKIVPSGAESGGAGDRSRAPTQQGNPPPEGNDPPSPDQPPAWAPFVVLPAQALDWYNRTVNRFIYDQLNNIGAGLRAWPGAFDLGGKIAAYYGAQGWFWWHQNVNQRLYDIPTVWGGIGKNGRIIAAYYGAKAWFWWDRNVNQRLYAVPGTVKILGALAVYGLWRTSVSMQTYLDIRDPMTAIFGHATPVAKPPLPNPPNKILVDNGYTEAELGQLAQLQPDQDTCAVYAAEMALNMLHGTNVSGKALEDWYVNWGYKWPALGTTPASQREALNHLFFYSGAPYVAELKTNATPADLIDNLNNGYITIVNTSNGDNAFMWPPYNGVGHAMVLVGYDTTNPRDPQYMLLDPGDPRNANPGTRTVTYKPEVDFLRDWLNQPNPIISAGTMITIKPK